MSKYKKILIVRMDRLGDVVLSTPAIKAVKDAYPDSHIAVMVRSYARAIVEGNPYINEVITYDKSKEGKGLGKNIGFILELKKKKFDLVIVLHPKTSSHMLLFLSGIPERVGYDRNLGSLLTKKIPHTKQFGLKHEIDYNLDLLRYIGIESKDRSLFVPLNKTSEKRIEDIFAKHGISKNDTIVTINPSASCPSKRWDARRFAKVADGLAAKYSAKIIIITGREDKEFGDKVAHEMTAKHLNLAGKTEVSDLASIFKRSKLFISNDSGPVHIACAVGTPVISIFGRSDRGLSPHRWGPSGKRDIVLHKDVGCEICLAHNCKLGFKCLDAITVDDVLSAASKILQQ